MILKGEKTYLKISDYPRLRRAFAELLAEIQRIKSVGDYEAAKELVETYAVKVNPMLHKEILERYKTLNLAPYKGFLNPRLTLVRADDGNIVDVVADYTETYEEQMMRYSHDYAAL